MQRTPIIQKIRDDVYLNNSEGGSLADHVRTTINVITKELEEIKDRLEVLEEKINEKTKTV